MAPVRLILCCFISSSMVFLIVSMFTSHWMNISQNGTIYYYGLSLFCINGTSSCHDIENENNNSSIIIDLNLLKILTIACLVLHIVILFQVYLLGKMKRQLVIHIVLDVTDSILLAIKIIIIVLFIYHIDNTVKYKIDWSFWIFIVSTLFCLLTVILTFYKTFWNYKSLNKEKRNKDATTTNGVVSSYIEDGRTNVTINNTSSYILSKFMKDVKPEVGLSNVAFDYEKMENF